MVLGAMRISGRRLALCVTLCVALPLVLVAAGCGGDGVGGPLIKVTGTVKFEDGSIPQGDYSAQVSFEPVEFGPGTQVAQGDIDPQTGAFTLLTKNEEGAIAGKYIVLVQVFDGYPDQKLAVPEQYTIREASPLRETVSATKTTFDFSIEKP